jgi:hypothetical protein
LTWFIATLRPSSSSLAWVSANIASMAAEQAMVTRVRSGL